MKKAKKEKQRVAAAMKILQREISKECSETPLFRFDFNLDSENNEFLGLCAVFQKKVYTAVEKNGHCVINSVDMPELYELCATKYIGCYAIEYTDKDGCGHELCRTDGKNKDALLNCAKIIHAIQSGKTFEKNEQKRYCPHCHKPLDKAGACKNCHKSKLALVLRFLALYRPYLPTMLLAILFFFGVSLLQLLVPELSRILVDEYITAPNAQSTVSFSSLVAVVLIMALLNLVMRAFEAARSILLLRSSNKLIVKLRTELFSKIQKLSLGKISEHTAGSLISRITQDTNTVNEFLTYRLPEIIQQFFIFTLVIVGMFLYDPLFALLVLAPCPLVLLLFNFIHKYLHSLYRRQWTSSSNSGTILHDIFQGIRVVKVFGMEKSESKKYGKVIYDEAKIREENEIAWNKVMPIANFLLGTGELILMYYVGVKILGNEMTFGQFTQFSAYITLIYGPLRFISHLPRILMRTGVSLNKIFEVLDEETDVPEKENATELDVYGKVEFKNVSFGYNEYEDVLKDISFTANRGEMIGIVGASGAGKSTLINLIMRLYEANEGQILIDGVDIKDISQKSLRSQIGAVLQETFLFSGTVLQNIRYAKPNASYDEIVRAAMLSGAHSFIMKLPDAYNTKIGEKGYTLSGGERQRIAIARAILHNPRILILDEATSALDTKTEKVIQQALERLTKNRTTFSIAHRLSTLRHATKLIVIDEGRIAETGTHAELLKKQGIYYRLVMAQRVMSKMQKNEEQEEK